MNPIPDDKLDALIDHYAQLVRLRQATDTEKAALHALRELRRLRKAAAA